MIKSSLPFFTGSNDVKPIFYSLLRAKQVELVGKDVLDLPAGYGDTANFLVGLGANVTGSDLYPEIVRFPYIKCVKGNLNEKLPFPDESFDWVICQEGIEHMPNQLHLFQELNRILRVGGKALITTPNYSNLRTRFSYALLGSVNSLGYVWAWSIC